MPPSGFGCVIAGRRHQTALALFKPGLRLRILADRLHGQILQRLGERIDDGSGVEFADGVAGFLVELLEDDREYGGQFVVYAPQGEGRRAEREGGEDGVRVAVGNVGEPVDALDIDATRAGLEMLVGGAAPCSFRRPRRWCACVDSFGSGGRLEESTALGDRGCSLSMVRFTPPPTRRATTWTRHPCRLKNAPASHQMKAY